MSHKLDEKTIGEVTIVKKGIVVDSKDNNHIEERDEKAKEAEEHAPPSTEVSTTEECPEIVKKRRFERMTMLKNLDHIVNKGVARHTRSYYNGKSKFKDPSRGSHESPAILDMSESDSEMDMPKNTCNHGTFGNLFAFWLMFLK